MTIKSLIKKIINQLFDIVIINWYRLVGPPRILKFGTQLNTKILSIFGAQIGKNTRVYSPIVFHNAAQIPGYKNLAIADNCVLNGNNFLDLSARITLEKGVSIGPGVTIMTHNGYNRNAFLVKRLPHTCGFKDVFIKQGANIKAHALIVMGVTVGQESVVAGGAVVNLDVPNRHLVAGVPARIVTEIF